MGQILYWHLTSWKCTKLLSKIMSRTQPYWKNSKNNTRFKTKKSVHSSLCRDTNNFFSVWSRAKAYVNQYKLIWQNETSPLTCFSIEEHKEDLVLLRVYYFSPMFGESALGSIAVTESAFFHPTMINCFQYLNPLNQIAHDLFLK